MTIRFQGICRISASSTKSYQTGWENAVIATTLLLDRAKQEGIPAAARPVVAQENLPLTLQADLKKRVGAVPNPPYVELYTNEDTKPFLEESDAYLLDTFRCLSKAQAFQFPKRGVVSPSNKEQPKSQGLEVVIHEPFCVSDAYLKRAQQGINGVFEKEIDSTESLSAELAHITPTKRFLLHQVLDQVRLLTLFSRLKSKKRPFDAPQNDDINKTSEQWRQFSLRMVDKYAENHPQAPQAVLDTFNERGFEALEPKPLTWSTHTGTIRPKVLDFARRTRKPASSPDGNLTA